MWVDRYVKDETCREIKCGQRGSGRKGEREGENESGDGNVERQTRDGTEAAIEQCQYHSAVDACILTVDDEIRANKRCFILFFCDGTG